MVLIDLFYVLCGLYVKSDNRKIFIHFNIAKKHSDYLCFCIRKSKFAFNEMNCNYC